MLSKISEISNDAMYAKYGVSGLEFIKDIIHGKNM